MGSGQLLMCTPSLAGQTTVSTTLIVYCLEGCWGSRDHVVSKTFCLVTPATANFACVMWHQPKVLDTSWKQAVLKEGIDPIYRTYCRTESVSTPSLPVYSRNQTPGTWCSWSWESHVRSTPDTSRNVQCMVLAEGWLGYMYSQLSASSWRGLLRKPITSSPRLCISRNAPVHSLAGEVWWGCWENRYQSLVVNSMPLEMKILLLHVNDWAVE